ncbi:adenylate/guanylate cyclase domain-containing protein [Trueperella pecoris]|uniref:Adenylate/guanylate cyclase domain-containing protein n=1 Tax=Trueperella pecoris TaxID=2733571 RepID=A0A7M1QSU7_9ACTO|nr:adenylate/guanylate cyclase domain-containing protein [Trueperella pecoris]QOR45222.1 adenylate/guanylate cyclase domain-containing protein [Trueperella pecoris]QTG75126.1 adenylate/guanylate cyclase domain-containing protein [Trueperella pecoris]
MLESEYRVARLLDVTQNTNNRGSSDNIPTTVEAHVRRLLDGPAKYQLREAADLANMDIDSARRFWRAMGFPYIQNAESRLFTEYDVDVMRAHQDMVDLGRTDEDTQNSLIRAQSHLADRLVLWQYEALVEEAEARHGLDELSARYWVLDHIGEYEEFLVYQMKYAWRRHLASFLRRTEVELENLRAHNDVILLTRALGFVDLVAFTNRSGQLSPHQLVDFIQTFEFTCRDVISGLGARVVKMVGDAVLYIADDLATGAEVVSSIVDALHATPEMPEVRASLVWGGIVSRFGDVFGPNVNLASRLCAIAPEGGIVVDRETAEALRALNPHKYRLEENIGSELRGIGYIESARLTVMKDESAQD